MIRILSLAAAVATLSLASCASLKKKGDCATCCSSKPAATQKECCAAKVKKGEAACCAEGAGHDHGKKKK